MRLLLALVALCANFAGTALGQEHSASRIVESFDEGWRFHAGDIRGAEQSDFNDSSWIAVDVPHDWSIEGRGLSLQRTGDDPVFAVVRGQWKFTRGDDTLWKHSDFNDSSWQTVTLPSTWEEHSQYTQDNVYGWYRRTLTIPAALQGRDVWINVGKIDDADETYVNGVKVGGMGHFPPAYVTAWDLLRLYKIPHDLIRYGEANSIAVRVFDGINDGGIYHDGATVKEGPFESTSAAGGGGGYINAGTGWYRKVFTLSGHLTDRRFFVEFDGIYMNSDVWINGVHLGTRPYGYSSFQYDLTPFLKFNGEKNIIAVRADVQQACSRWYSGAGIYRHVRLTAMDPVHIAHWGTVVTTPTIAHDAAKVRIETTLENQSATPHEATLELVITDEHGRVAGCVSAVQRLGADSSGAVVRTVTLPSPVLWSLDHPHLYHVTSTLHVEGRLADRSVTPFGIRSIAFTKDRGFFLNGKHVQIKGVCQHHDQGSLGAVANARAIERQLEILKAMGCNAIRTSHNPPDPHVLDLCDRMGFLVMDEAFDEWKQSKTLYGYGRFFDQWSKRDLTDMIRRDRNHPSIILWSIGNEIPEQEDAHVYEMAKRLADLCHMEDPTRPVTSACNLADAALKTGFAKALDVFGINYQLPAYAALRGHGPLIASETASAVSTRGEYNLVLEGDTPAIKNRLNNQCSSYEDSTAESYLRAVGTAPWIAGEFVWTGFDYIGEPSPFAWPSASSYFGIVDLCGFPKDRYYLYKSRWTDTPMVHVLPHWNWQGFEGRKIPVWCYSNCETVELFLNGKSLGEKTTAGTRALHLAWDVPYVPGTLKAVAKKNGIVVCTDEVSTTGAPAKILLSADRATIAPDGEDCSYITITVTDSAGRVCPNAENLVKCRIEGAGVIAGMGNGNPVSHEPFTARERKAFHGLCQAVVRSTRERGSIRLSAESDGLRAAEVMIQTK